MLEPRTRTTTNLSQLLGDATRLFTEASTSTSAVIDHLVDAAVTAIGDSCSVHLLDEDGVTLPLVALRHRVPEAVALVEELFRGQPNSIHDAPTGQVLATGTAIHVPYVDDRELRLTLSPAYGRYLDEFGISSMIMAPLRVQGETFGTLNVTRLRGGEPYADEDLKFVQELADRAATAIQNARLYERVEAAARKHSEAEDRLMLLVEAASQLIESLELEEVLPRILRLSSQLINADAHALWHYDETANSWEVLSSEGLSAEYLTNATFAVTESTPQLTSPLVIPDVYDDPMLDHRRAGYGPEGIHSLMVIPLRIAGELHGTLTFYYKSPHLASDDDVRIAQALASLASAAINSSRLHANTVRANDELAAANRRLALLSEASAVLSSTFDASVEDATGEHMPALGALAGLLVPAFASICVIDVIEGPDRSERLEAATVEGIDHEALARIHLRDWRVAADRSTTVMQALAAGRSVVIEDVSEAWMRACAPNEEQIALAKRIGAHSIIMSPLRAHGQTIGAFTAAAVGTSRAFTAADRQLIEEVARRAAVALDNARLFTAAQRTADELRDANAAKDEFLGLVSHELKTPITTILGNAEVLERRFEQIPDVTRVEALADIRAEAERLHRIIDNLLVLARLEQGRTIEREPMLVRRVVEQILTSHQRMFPRRTIKVHWDVEPTPVLGSPQYLEQTLRNLLGNAEKYSPPDRVIELQARRDGDELVVRVLDEGPGVREDEIEAVFTPFYRSRTTASLAQGVGIGLAVCRRLMEAQGGRIWARRRSPEGGSEFGFALPIVDE